MLSITRKYTVRGMAVKGMVRNTVMSTVVSIVRIIVTSMVCITSEGTVWCMVIITGKGKLRVELHLTKLAVRERIRQIKNKRTS